MRRSRDSSEDQHSASTQTGRSTRGDGPLVPQDLGIERPGRGSGANAQSLSSCSQLSTGDLYSLEQQSKALHPLHLQILVELLLQPMLNLRWLEAAPHGIDRSVQLQIGHRGTDPIAGLTAQIK